jgi:hypothetical protein
MTKILLAGASLLLLATTRAARQNAITGTWSGYWAPKGGTQDAITIELRQDAAGKLTGTFVTPTPMDFNKASFTPATHTIAFEPTNVKTGNVYKLDGKIKGTEVIGTLAVNDTSGEVRLIKWTVFWPLDHRGFRQ